MRFLARFGAKSALAVTLCWVAVLALTGSTEALLFLAPALLIAVPLLGGRYVGEELIARLVARRTRPRRRALASPAPHSPLAAALRPRGTALLAFSLAKRPPPPHPLPQN